VIVAGRGNVGRSLYRALGTAGHHAQLMPARGAVPELVREIESLRPAMVFLAVPDGAVATLASQIIAAGPRMPAGTAFVHISGALELGALQPLRARHAVGSFHPLQSFPEPRPATAFRGIVIAVDASTEGLRRRLVTLARQLGASAKHVEDSRRVVYHAAAVFASNYTDVLLDVAVGLLEAIGWSEHEALGGLGALAEGAVTSVRKRGPVAALTGPIRRGDAVTVVRHLAALRELETSGAVGQGHLVDLYRMLGAIALEIAKEAGLEPAAAEPVARALTQEVAATRRRRRA
jgi:predicted short-subunit dehydrogenase-like oxidoreductase (DUF2520 family)